MTNNNEFQKKFEIIQLITNTSIDKQKIKN